MTTVSMHGLKYLDIYNNNIDIETNRIKREIWRYIGLNSLISQTQHIFMTIKYIV